MSKVDRGAFFAVGLVSGVALALALLMLVVPEFRDPTNYHAGQEPTDRVNGNEEPEKRSQKPQWRYWTERLILLEDTPAQWGMAIFAVIAVGVSAYGIRLLKKTIDATREVGRDQSRAYLHVDAADFMPGRDGSHPRAVVWIKNTGQTPARWFHLVATVNLYPIDYTQPFAIEAIDGPDHAGGTWNALGGGDKLSVPVGISKDVSTSIFKAYATRKNWMVIMSGFVRYETFFSETFETEFMFVSRPLPTYRAQSTDRPSEAAKMGLATYTISTEQPNMMQRAGRRLSSYKRVG